MLREVPRYRSAVPSSDLGRERSLRQVTRRWNVLGIGRFARDDRGLATIEYIIGAAVVLGTLVVGVQAWNNGLVLRLEALVTQMGSVH
jgi:Flp pilus assembly pilin Flp